MLWGRHKSSGPQLLRTPCKPMQSFSSSHTADAVLLLNLSSGKPFCMTPRYNSLQMT